MTITHLDHVNLRTEQLDWMIDWYGQVLELTPGPRPDFPFPGAWLYAGETVMVHLVGVSDAGTGSEDTLKLEHFAFRGKGAQSFEERLVGTGTRFRKVEIDEIKTVAFNIWDPDGNHIHVDFDFDD